jgi:hypothetical protein
MLMKKQEIVGETFGTQNGYSRAHPTGGGTV